MDIKLKYKMNQRLFATERERCYSEPEPCEACKGTGMVSCNCGKKKFLCSVCRGEPRKQKLSYYYIVRERKVKRIEIELEGRRKPRIFYQLDDGDEVGENCGYIFETKKAAEKKCVILNKREKKGAK